MQVHLQIIYVKFVCQGHQVKVRIKDTGATKRVCVVFADDLKGDLFEIYLTTRLTASARNVLKQNQ